MSLHDFAAGFGEEGNTLPAWVHPHAAAPSFLESLGLRYRVEDVLDTIVALQRAERLHDGIYAGPDSMSAVYRDVLHAARTLHVAVPPAILAGIGSKMQGCFGTDGRAFLYLSTWFFDAASEPERWFLAGRLCGHIAARQVTAHTMYSLIADQNGLRQIARRLGPVLDVILAPVSLGVRIALSRWHRAAVITADRAGLLVCRDLQGAGSTLMRMNLGMRPGLNMETFLEQRRTHGNAPGRWTEWLSAEPWTHKRMLALELFAKSEVYARLTDTVVDDPIPLDELNDRTTKLLGVSA